MRQIGSRYSLTIPFGTRPCHQLMQTYRYKPLQQAAVVPEKGKKPSEGKKKAGKKIALLTVDRVWNHENNIRKCPNSSFTFIS